MKVQGRCHCGAITYEAEVEPGTVKVCHCRGRALPHRPVYSCAEKNPKSYTLRLGALSERDSLGHPAEQIWTKRRLSWIPRLEGVKDIEGQP